MRSYLKGVSHDECRELTARYEQLRGEGMQRKMSRELSVFLTDGMWAWMQAWLTLPIETSDGLERSRKSGLDGGLKEESRFPLPGTGVSTGIWSEAVNILTAMTVAQLRGDVI
jgi:hypothetical protein